MPAYTIVILYRLLHELIYKENWTDRVSSPWVTTRYLLLSLKNERTLSSAFYF